MGDCCRIFSGRSRGCFVVNVYASRFVLHGCMVGNRHGHLLADLKTYLKVSCRLESTGHSTSPHPAQPGPACPVQPPKCANGSHIEHAMMFSPPALLCSCSPVQCSAYSMCDTDNMHKTYVCLVVVAHCAICLATTFAPRPPSPSLHSTRHKCGSGWCRLCSISSHSMPPS